jgi:cytochrome c-type biogenesis protein CcmH
MMLWVILALMTAVALGAVIWPLVRTRRWQTAGSDLAVYRDQLEEIERDRTEGRIGSDEFEAARIEVSRRLLGAATSAARNAPEADEGNRSRILALVAATCLIPLLAAPLYALLGSPDLPGQPLADRGRGEDGNSVASLIARIEAHLEENPDDGRGWEVLAPVYMQLDRYDDAVKARRNALRIMGDTPARYSNLGEALTAAAGGVVTSEAKQAFEQAVAVNATEVKALFYLGLAAEQDGQTGEAARLWHQLADKAPPDAPYLPVVRQSLARVEGGAPGGMAAAGLVGPAPAAAPGPRAEDVAAAGNMTPEQRNTMIRCMVDQLATRLHQDGSDVDGWLRLLRAYMVLGERDKAKAAAGEARGALAHEPDKLHRLDDAIKELGVEG